MAAAGYFLTTELNVSLGEAVGDKCLWNILLRAEIHAFCQGFQFVGQKEYQPSSRPAAELPQSQYTHDLITQKQ